MSREIENEIDPSDEPTWGFLIIVIVVVVAAFIGKMMRHPAALAVGAAIAIGLKMLVSLTAGVVFVGIYVAIAIITGVIDQTISK